MIKKTILFFFSIIFIQCNSVETNKDSTDNVLNKSKTENTDWENKKFISQNYDQIDRLIDNANNEFKLNKNSALGNSYWRDSIPNLLKNTFIENFKLKKVDGSEFDLSKTNKPIFLQFSSAWSYPYKTEISALNKIAEEYSDRIEFVLFLTEDLEHLKNKLKNYNQNISLILHTKWPNNNKVKIGEINISGFKHKLGYPFNYLISSEKQIIHAAIGKVEVNDQNLRNSQILDLNYQLYEDQIKMLLDSIRPANPIFQVMKLAINGESKKGYCELMGLNYGTFMSWLRREEGESKAGEFISLGSISMADVEVLLPNGIRLNFKGGFSKEVLKSMMDV